jgi:hypothetical protein
MHPLLSAALAPILALGTEYYLFGIAGLVAVTAFAGLILAPALGAYGRGWEKAAAAFVSLFVLAALVLAGLAIGVLIFFNWDTISDWI